MSVSVVKTKPSYNNIERIAEALKRALDLIDYKPKKETLLLKPNVGSPHGSIKKGDYVPATFCAAFSLIYPDRKIIVAEGTANGMDWDKSMENFGYLKMIKQFPKIKLVNLKIEKERVDIDWKYGKIKIPKILSENEYINVAKFKTHYFSHISMCMKNQKGALTDAMKKKFHQMDLQDAIYQLSQVVVPDLNVLDGLIGIDGNGPNSMFPINVNRTQKMGLILASKNICEIDRVAVEITGLDLSKTHIPKDTPFEIVGDKDARYPFKEPTLGQQFKMMNFHMQLKSSCSGCMESFLSCADLMMKRNPLSPKVMRANMDFMTYGIAKPLILYFGPDCTLVEGTCKEKSKMVCVGVCTKKLAEEHGLPYIPGCPPTAEEMLAYTLPRKQLEKDYCVIKK